MFKDIWDKIYNKLVALKSTTTLNEVYNFYPKQFDSYPLAIVYPSDSNEIILDSVQNTIEIPYIVTIIDTYDDPSTVEAKLRTLVDSIIDNFRKDQELRTWLNRLTYTLSIQTNWTFNTDEANYRIIDIILRFRTVADIL